MELLNGNTFEIIKTFEDESFDLICTDPPFGQNINYGRSQLGHRTIENDNNLEWLDDWSKNAYRILKNNTHCIVFWQWRTYSQLENIMLKNGFILKTVGIWDKKNAGLGNGLAEQYEQICFFKKGNARQNFFRGNVFRIGRINGRPEHPHQKPVDLICELLKLCSKENDSVLDCFMGSGSVGLACKATNRNFTGIELDENYFNLSKQTIETPISVSLF